MKCLRNWRALGLNNLKLKEDFDLKLKRRSEL